MSTSVPMTVSARCMSGWDCWSAYPRSVGFPIQVGKVYRGIASWVVPIFMYPVPLSIITVGFIEGGVE